MASCSQCGVKADPSVSWPHDCGHLTHTKCMGNTPNYEKCHQCVSGIIVAPRGVIEPFIADERDYATNPNLKQPTRGWLTRGKTKLFPHELLQQRIPISDMWAEPHGYGLDHMCEGGVKIDHFLKGNHYTWDDLLLYNDIGKKSSERCLNVLVRGLCLTANHLRDYRDQLPIDKIRARTAIQNRQFCELLGMVFDDDGPLSCHGDTRWDANDCVYFGLTTQDLINFGMSTKQQYIALMKPLLKEERIEAEIKLKTTPAQLATLIDAVRYVEEEDDTPAPAGREEAYHSSGEDTPAPAGREEEYQYEEEDTPAPQGREEAYHSDEEDTPAPQGREESYQYDEEDIAALQGRQPLYHSDEEYTPAPAGREQVPKKSQRTFITVKKNPPLPRKVAVKQIAVTIANPKARIVKLPNKIKW